MEESDIICMPIKSLEELGKFIAPTWAKNAAPLQESGWCTKAGRGRCHVKLDDWKTQLRYFRNTVPRTLVCHDMRGGYLDDKFVNGCNNGSAYNFYHWNVIDIFVYFSHHFITIPPLGWINAAHKHGVSILGTIIVENEDGLQRLSTILEKAETIESFVDDVVKITSDFGLDGWLLNIETKTDNVKALKQLVKLLNTKLHDQNPKSLLIWYDSVINTGQLRWQNELNEKNSDWFNLCDGIFLNYNWDEKMLANTKSACGTRNLDIYVGIDVFGRNCVGGMDSWKPLEMIRSFGFSAAIFAPGWTYETLEPTPDATFQIRYQQNDQRFWKLLGPYLYEHGVQNNIFSTTFNSGCCKGSYNLSKQDIPVNSLILGQSSKLLQCLNEISKCEEPFNETRDCECITIEEKCIKMNGTCIKISNIGLGEGKFVHRLLSCDVHVKTSVLVAMIFQKIQEFENLELIVQCQEINGRTDIISSKESELVIDETEKCSVLKKGFDIQKMLDSQWQLKCLKIQKPGTKILEIGVILSEMSEIIVGGLTVQTYPLKRTL